MRTIYLIRHCEPAFPQGRHVCLSGEDLPLSQLGRMRSMILAESLSHAEINAAFCSTLRRARETAAGLSSDVKPIAGFEELGMGVWDGLTFRKIRSQYPELYEKRGEAPFVCCPPGGEPPADCLARVRSALMNLLERTSGNIAIIAHAGVNRLLLCKLLGRDMNEFLKLPQPYGCVNTLCCDGASLTVKEAAEQPHPELTPALCKKLASAAGTPERVWEHAQAVAARADKLGASLNKLGYELDLDLLRAAALLHDIARTEPGHARIGGEWLTELGYPEVGEIIAAHHEMPDSAENRVSESAVLYLADKQIRGTCRVTVDSRFAESRKKCVTPEAQNAHERRYRQAKRVETLILSAVGVLEGVAI